MKTTLLAALIAAPLLATAAAASSDDRAPADLAPGTQFGTTAAEIRGTLTGLGYDVRKIESDDGLLEVYAVKDGRKAELYVSPATGQVTYSDDD